MAERKERKSDQEIVLSIINGRENELFKEQNILEEDALMYPAYQAALNALQEIIDSTDRWYSKHVHGKCSEYDNDLYGFANNIIAFCANRGQGKTSAMMSFSSALDFRKCHGWTWTEEDEKKLQKWVGSCRFFVLPPIDPTMLSAHDSAITLILTNMLKEIQVLWEHSTSNKPHDYGVQAQEDKKYKILRTFQECLDGLRIEQDASASDSKSNFDNFAQSNDVFTLKKNIHKIIQYLFELRGWDRENSFLVVQLDDTDMQMDYAYATMEYVRKYLSIPNTVVLMATDINQLRSLVNWHYRNKLHCQSNEKLDFNFDYMAAKYIDKLIPAPQTIHLPTIKSQMYLGKDIILRVYDSNDTKSADSEKTIEAAIFDLIYARTGLVFIKHKSYMHEILPSTLRGYMHLYRLMERMESIMSEEELSKNLNENFPNTVTPEYCKARLANTQKKLRNLSEFENYFVNEWIPSRVQDENNRRSILALKDVSSARLFQHIVVHLLPRFSKSKFEKAKKNRNKGQADYQGDQPEKNDDNDLKDYDPINEKPEDLLKYKKLLNKYIKDNSLTPYKLFLNRLNSYLRNICSTNAEYNFAFAIGTFVSIQLHKYAMADEIESLRNWEQKGSFKFPTLTRMTAGKEESSSGRETIKKALENESPPTYYDEHIDKCLFAQGCIEWLNEVEKAPNKFTKQKMISLQDSIVYFCCNWDVLRQVLENVQIPVVEKREDQMKVFLNGIKNCLTGKKAVGFPTKKMKLFECLIESTENESHDTDKQNA